MSRTFIATAFFALAIIISLFLFSRGGTEIPEEALQNPEYGLPEKD